MRMEVDRQQRHPIFLVQEVCRELEKQGLRFFKRDKKSTFVCRNRPRWIGDGVVLSDRVRSIIEMVQANPGILYNKLVSTLAPPVDGQPRKKAKVDKAKKPVVAEIKEVKQPEEVKEPEAAEAAAQAAEAAVGSEEINVPVGSQTATAALTTGTVEEAPAPETAPEPPAVEAAAAEEAEELPILSTAEIAIMQDVKWLVQEGYITEFSQGELYILGRETARHDSESKNDGGANLAEMAAEIVSDAKAAAAEAEASQAEQAPTAEQLAAAEETSNAEATPAVEAAPEPQPPSQPEVPTAE
jgi:hypothetical protein